MRSVGGIRDYKWEHVGILEESQDTEGHGVQMVGAERVEALS